MTKKHFLKKKVFIKIFIFFNSNSFGEHHHKYYQLLYLQCSFCQITLAKNDMANNYN